MSVAIAMLDIDRLEALAPAFDLLPYGEAAQRACLALRSEDGRVLLAVAREAAGEILPWAGARLAVPFALCFANRGDISAILARHANAVRAMDAIGPDAGTEGTAGAGVESLQLDTIHAEASPIVRLTNSTIYDAYRAGASDIHLETTADGLRVKYRLDGVLSRMTERHGIQTAEQVISRIKVMAELDIAERRVPQDGRFKVAIDGRDVDLRVSIMPSIYGEDAVLRILDKHALTDQLSSLTLESLGFEADTIRGVRRLAREPAGRASRISSSRPAATHASWLSGNSGPRRESHVSTSSVSCFGRGARKATCSLRTSSRTISAVT